MIDPAERLQVACDATKSRRQRMDAIQDLLGHLNEGGLVPTPTSEQLKWLLICQFIHESVSREVLACL